MVENCDCIEVGRKVCHEIYGEGEVISISDDTRCSCIYQVLFPHHDEIIMCSADQLRLLPK